MRSAEQVLEDLGPFHDHILRGRSMGDLYQFEDGIALVNQIEGKPFDQKIALAFDALANMQIAAAGTSEDSTVDLAGWRVAQAAEEDDDINRAVQAAREYYLRRRLDATTYQTHINVTTLMKYLRLSADELIGDDIYRPAFEIWANLSRWSLNDPGAEDTKDRPQPEVVDWNILGERLSAVRAVRQLCSRKPELEVAF